MPFHGNGSVFKQAFLKQGYACQNKSIKYFPIACSSIITLSDLRAAVTV